MFLEENHHLRLAILPSVKTFNYAKHLDSCCLNHSIPADDLGFASFITKMSIKVLFCNKQRNLSSIFRENQTLYSQLQKKADPSYISVSKNKEKGLSAPLEHPVVCQE